MFSFRKFVSNCSLNLTKRCSAKAIVVQCCRTNALESSVLGRLNSFSHKMRLLQNDIAKYRTTTIERVDDVLDNTKTGCTMNGDQALILLKCCGMHPEQDRIGDF